MDDPTPPRPAPVPPPDRHQLERLNELYDLTVSDLPAGAGWRDTLLDRVRAFLVRLLFRQQEFNAAVVDHINRNALVGIEAHHASERTIAWVERTVQDSVDRLAGQTDELRRHQEALGAWEQRSGDAVARLTASHEELRTSIGVLQQAAHALKRDVGRLTASGAMPPAVAPSSAEPASPAAVAAGQLESADSHTYVGFEDLFRGSADDITERVSEYLPFVQGASDVLDIGCGRGEFLALLREHGIRAKGIDINGSMVEVCRQQGLDATEADALSYLRAQPDNSLGGLFAAQVVEHLEPRYLTGLLDIAFDKLRPGAPIILETINPACWFAFFESYIRDITHVRPIHPDTLTYLLVASGFQHVDVRYRAPYPEHDKLQRIAPQASLGDSVDTLNANVERLNSLLFTWLDYAAIGRRP
ncbi:MAG: class I SAM-dependent methyltransferase [Acidobacteria bacterium]|nr:class I SAM-dependent methyltransferase [Acidobacteriota bacterium]